MATGVSSFGTFLKGPLSTHLKAVTRSVTETPWHGAAQLGTAATSTAWRARRIVTGEMDQTV
jgi:hypothetical protein